MAAAAFDCNYNLISHPAFRSARCPSLLQYSLPKPPFRPICLSAAIFHPNSLSTRCDSLLQYSPPNRRSTRCSSQPQYFSLPGFNPTTCSRFSANNEKLGRAPGCQSLQPALPAAYLLYSPPGFCVIFIYLLASYIYNPPPSSITPPAAPEGPISSSCPFIMLQH